ncbi:MAG: ribonuclease Z [Acidobacteriota bacterium]
MLRLVVLGSGASLPTLQRQTAAAALQRDGDVLLLDCGEGTQLQWRHAGLRFSKLRYICISHLHGDHVNGLVGFLQTLSLTGRLAPLTLVGPLGLAAYLRAARRHLGLRLTYELEVEEHDGGLVLEAAGYKIYCAALDHGMPTLGFSLVEEKRPGKFDVQGAMRLGVPEGPLYGQLQRGQTVELANGQVVHPDQVLGPSRPGCKVAYCVDTRPCEAAIDLARGADLLVCDATFTEELAEEADRRGHCTAAQAAQMSRQADVRQLLLTHISARYHDPRPLLQEAAAVFSCSQVAEDLMEVTLGAAQEER